MTVRVRVRLRVRDRVRVGVRVRVVSEGVPCRSSVQLRRSARDARKATSCAG